MACLATSACAATTPAPSDDVNIKPAAQRATGTVTQRAEPNTVGEPQPQGGGLWIIRRDDLDAGRGGGPTRRKRNSAQESRRSDWHRSRRDNRNGCCEVPREACQITGHLAHPLHLRLQHLGGVVNSHHPVSIVLNA
jgi:hypothetical protein